MKKYQMPNVKEEKLESSLFIMNEPSPTNIQPVNPLVQAPSHSV